MVAVPVAVGCYAWYRRPEARFGPLLVATGFAWFLTTLSESDDPLLYSIGRVAGWLVELELVFLTLSFPTGRLPARVDRVLVGAFAALVAVLYLPTALIADSYPLPAPYTTCSAGCPENAFFVLGSEPGFVDSIVIPVRDLLTVIVLLAVTARVGDRVRNATPPMRRALAPVLTVVVARVALVAVGVAARRGDAPAAALDVVRWMISLWLPVMAASFLLGLIRWRFFVADALQTLGRRLSTDLSPRGLRDALAEALDDPSLWLAYWVPLQGGRWLDADGTPVELPEPGTGTSVTEVLEGETPIAAIVHDEALLDQPELLDAIAAYARMALQNERLGVKVESSLREVQESRARILATADRERRRIERDLHDGAQQRLVALRMKLELAEEVVREDPEAGLGQLHALGPEIEETLDEIRSLARGVYPALLADQGLPAALRAVALHAAVPVTLELDGARRYPKAVENAVYFCCLEALQNASKHARGLTRIDVRLSAGETLRFEVRDDGGGFEPHRTPAGEGMTNMRDRLGSVGGELTIVSAPGAGVVVAGSVPVGSD